MGIQNEYPQAQLAYRSPEHLEALAKLKNCKSVSDIASLIRYKPKTLAYIVYWLDDSKKYTSFEIPKASSGTRLIHAPVKKVKLAQSRLAKLLQNCLDEIESSQSQNKSHILSHGFKPKLSIASNAKRHVGRRWVLNLDIKDFFPSLNFGRVRGFFIRNKHFEMDPKAATVIARIACHENSLPQGAPTSPVISNLVANILDIRCNKLAKRFGCSYTRYADDITLSTNLQKFPENIAKLIDKSTNEWRLSKRILKEFQRAGFVVNDQKTRMQYRRSRQDVTGLVVNKKINVKRERYKIARAQVHSLITTGECWQNKKTEGKIEKERLSTNSLQGMLSHIYQIKIEEYGYKKFDGHNERKPAFYQDYRKFLDYQTFVDAPKPVLICEGKTDNIYLRCAIKKLKRSTLFDAEKNELLIRFFSYSDTTKIVQNLGGGTGDLTKLIGQYLNRVKLLDKNGFRHPVILLVDNDQGAKKLFSSIKNVTKCRSDIDGSEDYYAVTKNLYVIPTPKLENGRDSMIEDFFPPKVKDEKLNGKTLYLQDEGFDKTKHFGKSVFAKNVVLRKQGNIEFSGFIPILERIEQVIKDFNETNDENKKAILN